jgi:hypothetical protein
MPLKKRIHEVRVTLANRRTQRAAHRRLSAELAAFATPAERAELDSMIGRHSYEDTRQIRAILNQQDFERQRTPAALSGGYRA